MRHDYPLHYIFRPFSSFRPFSDSKNLMSLGVKELDSRMRGFFRPFSFLRILFGIISVDK